MWEKNELFRRTDDETEQFFSFRSGEKPFLPMAKIFFEHIFPPMAEKIFSFFSNKKTKFATTFLAFLTKQFK